MVKLLFLKMLRDMKKSLAAYGICLLIVGVGLLWLLRHVGGEGSSAGVQRSAV